VVPALHGLQGRCGGACAAPHALVHAPVGGLRSGGGQPGDWARLRGRAYVRRQPARQSRRPRPPAVTQRQRLGDWRACPGVLAGVAACRAGSCAPLPALASNRSGGQARVHTRGGGQLARLGQIGARGGWERQRPVGAGQVAHVCAPIGSRGRCGGSLTRPASLSPWRPTGSALRAR